MFKNIIVEIGKDSQLTMGPGGVNYQFNLSRPIKHW